MRVAHAAEIDAPVERVWELVTDVDRWPERLDTVTSLRRGRGRAGELALDDVGVVGQPGFPTEVWQVTRVDTHERFSWVTHHPMVTTWADHRLTRLGADRTRLELVITMTGPLRLVGRLLYRDRIRRVLESEVATWKQLAESG